MPRIRIRVVANSVSSPVKEVTRGPRYPIVVVTSGPSVPVRSNDSLTTDDLIRLNRQ